MMAGPLLWAIWGGVSTLLVKMRCLPKRMPGHDQSAFESSWLKGHLDWQWVEMGLISAASMTFAAVQRRLRRATKTRIHASEGWNHAGMRKPGIWLSGKTASCFGRNECRWYSIGWTDAGSRPTGRSLRCGFPRRGQKLGIFEEVAEVATADTHRRRDGDGKNYHLFGLSFANGVRFPIGKPAGLCLTYLAAKQGKVANECGGGL